MKIVRPVCKECGGRLWQPAKSHKHYTHLTATGCPIQKVDGSQVRMEVVHDDKAW